MNGEVIIKEMGELKEKVDSHGKKLAIADVKFGTLGQGMDKLADAIEKDREQRLLEISSKPKQMINDVYKTLGLFITIVLGLLAIYFK